MLPAETLTIVSGIVSNGAFIGAVAFFGARWMNKVDKNADTLAEKLDTRADTLAEKLGKRADDLAERVKKDAEDLAIERKADAKTLAEDLKQSVLIQHRELKETSDKIEKHLDNIYSEIRTANGRTAKIEGGMLAIERVCDERHRSVTRSV